MKKSMPSSKEWTAKFGGEKFFRNGKAGDWKNYLDDEKRKEIDNMTLLRFAGTNIKYFEDLVKMRKDVRLSKL